MTKIRGDWSGKKDTPYIHLCSKSLSAIETAFRVNSIPDVQFRKNIISRIAVLNVESIYVSVLSKFHQFHPSSRQDWLYYFWRAIIMYSLDVCNRYYSLIKYAPPWREMRHARHRNSSYVRMKFRMTQSQFHEIFGPLHSHHNHHK